MDARGLGSEGSEIAQDFLEVGDESVWLGTGDECAVRAEAAVEKRLFEDWETSFIRSADDISSGEGDDGEGLVLAEI